jgi:hypothetical protein
VYPNRHIEICGAIRLYKAFFAASRKKTLVLSIIIPSLVMSEKVIIIIETSAAECFTP